MLKKALYSLGGGIFLILTAGVLYLFTAFPTVDEAPEIVIEGTSEQVDRGKYLANNVAVCIDCHSERDWSRFSGPLLEDTNGKGGDIFDEKMGLPGTLYAKNITPSNLGDWTDGEIYRLITIGVNKDGEPMERPEETNILEYGKYMTTMVACAACHTPEVQGTPVAGLFMAGGFEFTLPGGVVRSSNLTPHDRTGIGLWTEEQFIARFKSYDIPGD